MGLFDIKKKILERQKSKLQKTLGKEIQLASVREDVSSIRKRIRHHKARGVEPQSERQSSDSLQKLGKGVGDFLKRAGEVSLVSPEKKITKDKPQKAEFFYKEYQVKGPYGGAHKVYKKVKIKTKKPKKRSRSPFEPGLSAGHWK